MYKAETSSFDGIPKISKDDLINTLSEERIFEYYLGIRVKTKNIHSPLREDNNPSCGFYYNPHGRLKYYDKAENINEDCFGIVALKCNISSFPLVLERIYKDFGLTKSSIISSPYRGRDYDRKEYRINFYAREFNHYDLKYWYRGNIDIKLLKENNVYAVDDAYLDGSLYYCYNRYDPCYAYIEEGIKKLYFPFRKKPRFRSESHLPISGYNKLPTVGDYVIITKSKKDELCLKAFGINNVISSQSESSVLDKTVVEDLDNRFDNIFILNDYDNTGLINTRKNIFNYPQIKPLFIRDSAKDSFGYCEKYGKDAMWELVRKFEIYVEQFIYK